MKNTKKIIRLLLLILLLLIASFGLGFTSSLFGNKERYENNEVRIELAEKKDEEVTGEENKVKN